MNIRLILMILALALYCVFLLPIFGWDIKVQAVIVLLIIQLLWVGKVFPLAYSSAILMVILSFHFFSFEETMNYFGSGIVWLLFSTFIIARAFMYTGLADRLSLRILKLSRGSSKQLLLNSFFLMVVLSPLIPSNVGKGSLVASVLDSIFLNLKDDYKTANLSRALFIGLTYVIALSGAIVATGANSTIYTFGVLSMVTEMNYLKWFMLFGPPILLFIFILWLLFLVIFPPEVLDSKKVIGLIDEKLNSLGKITIDEVKMLSIILLAVLLWITEEYHGYSISFMAFLCACLTMAPVIGIWKWEEARKSIDWDMILFFAGTLMISGMLIDTGTVDWLSNRVTFYFRGLPSEFLLIFIIVLTALLRLAFVNVLGYLTIVIPISLSVGEQINDISQASIVMGVFLAGVPGFLLISQSPVHLISYKYNYFREKELLFFGIFAKVCWLLIVILFSLYIW